MLVEVHTAVVNRINNMIMTGSLKSVLKFDLTATLGGDLAGIVNVVGSRDTRFKEGDAMFDQRVRFGHPFAR
ncbi:hypothetical protein VC273_22275 [Xanthomonas nasturtii]|uniref:alcohol dehydrogenase catalytic domain-containing protein n=2 Tax=Xanthomonas TaxID=338 RepID=UPI001379F0BA|nr:hypothetical protein [Xanthomonas arboricola]MEA9558512.1 hypothetical protein [Xanthomonas nasturtii]